MNEICVYMTNSKYHNHYNIIKLVLAPYTLQKSQEKYFKWRYYCKNNKKQYNTYHTCSCFTAENVKENVKMNDVVHANIRAEEIC